MSILSLFLKNVAVNTFCLLVKCPKCYKHIRSPCKDSYSSNETIESTVSKESDEETKTDTTICSLATIDYEDETPRWKSPRRKVKVTTKANQSTATDVKRVCDVSTVTSDWWSPILERRKNNLPLKKEEQHKISTPVKTRRRNAGMSTEGRVVKFQSDAQIIPSGKTLFLRPQTR